MPVQEQVANLCCSVSKPARFPWVPHESSLYTPECVMNINYWCCPPLPLHILVISLQPDQTGRWGGEMNACQGACINACRELRKRGRLKGEMASQASGAAEFRRSG